MTPPLSSNARRAELTLEEVLQIFGKLIIPDRNNFSSGARACTEISQFLLGPGTPQERRDGLGALYQRAHTVVPPKEAKLRISHHGNLHTVRFDSLKATAIATLCPVPSLAFDGSEAEVREALREFPKLKWSPVGD